MDRPVSPADLERRKKVRLRIRCDLDIAPQKYEGRTYYVVKDPISLRYWRFKEDEHFLLSKMDGTMTLDDAQKEYELRFRPSRLSLEDLEAFGQQLLNAGLAQNESPQAGKQLYTQRKKRRRTEWMQTLTNILYIKIPIFDPDKLLGRMLPYMRWIFTITFLVASVSFMLAAIILVATHFETFRDKLPSYQQFFSFKNLAYMWAALGVVKVIHEFGHGLSCKAFGGEVHEMGALFLVFSPALYCNVSDSWTMPNKWKRIIISSAGIWVELIIAAIATFVWWNSPGHPFINNLSLSLMVVCSISTVVFNANPLMRYDGYYMLADWLEIPNLRDRSNRLIKNALLEHCMGVEVPPEQYMARWRKVLFGVYAVISYFYKWIITYSILWFMYSFLRPYKLGSVSALLAIASLGSMVGWPVYRFGKSLYKRGRLPDMKPVRMWVSGGIVAVLMLLFFLVPVPVSRVRQLGLVQVQPDATVKVFVPEPGTLQRIDVVDGQRIPGDYSNFILAVFRNLDLENQLDEAKTQRDVSIAELTANKQRLDETKDNERGRLEFDIAKAASERDWYASLAKQYEARKERLVLRAPRSGIVMSPPRVDEIGKLWEKEQGVPFCSIGDPERLQILLPVTPADHRLLTEDRNALVKNGRDLDVTIRIHGLGNKIWKGKVVYIPESEAKEVPMALTTKAGGPVPTKPNPRPNVHVPQNQQYLVYINIEKPDATICPGTLAQVKIHCRWRTCAWWVWRTISATFDLGLI